MPRGRPPRSHERWPSAMIEAEMGKVRSGLDAFPTDTRDGRKARLAAALQGVVAGEGDRSERGQLRRYLFVMSSLVHHERHGGLTVAQVRRLAELALAILQVERISPTSARLGYLYGDVHLVMSQIQRRRGQHWSAAWQQQLARRLFRRNQARGPAFQSLSLAIRALRIGQADNAAMLYERAEALSTDARGAAVARLGRIRCLRLSGQLEAAADLASASSALFTEQPRLRLELDWEAECRRAQATGDLESMIAFARRDGDQSGAVFLLEAWLWTCVVPSRLWMARVPSAGSLARSKTARARRHGELFRCVATLQDCYEKSVPYDVKLRKLGEMLDRVELVVSVEAELLVLAAAVRWLKRMQADDLAVLTFGRYQVLSWALTSGRDGDLFRVAQRASERSLQEAS